MPQTFPGRQFPKLPVNSQTISSGSGGLAVVDTTSNILEWKEPNLPSLQDDDRLRCLSSGWGATCKGISTRGPWSPQEQTLHINCLELLAATLAVQTFVKEKSGISILLRIDNTTAVAYINRKGGTVSPTLLNLANIALEAQYLPGVMNSIADRESRTWLDRSEWKLCPQIFQRINAQLGPLLTDLFASRLSNQLPIFVSWKPDPLALVTDAFSLVWSDLPQKIYANPPWGLIGRVLSQTHSQSIPELILIASVWKLKLGILCSCRGWSEYLYLFLYHQR